jgi:hypothetical protein
MISFDLSCSAGHGFEGWFASFDEFQRQSATALLQCPICGSSVVNKRISAPHVGRKGNQSVRTAAAPKAAETSTQIAIPDPQLTNTPSPEISEAIISRIATIQAEILKESRWVGRKFADEARAIHYGEAAPQQIHGESSPQEANALLEEGITIAALPLPIIPPEAKN